MAYTSQSPFDHHEAFSNLLGAVAHPVLTHKRDPTVADATVSVSSTVPVCLQLQSLAVKLCDCMSCLSALTDPRHINARTYCFSGSLRGKSLIALMEAVREKAEQMPQQEPELSALKVLDANAVHEDPAQVGSGMSHTLQTETTATLFISNQQLC